MFSKILNFLIGRKGRSIVAQILVLVILFPTIATILSVFYPSSKDLQKFIVNLMGELPFFELSIDLINDAYPTLLCGLFGSSGSLSATVGGSSILMDMATSILESLIVAVVLKIAIGFHKMLTGYKNRRGQLFYSPPILMTFFTVMFCVMLFSIASRVLQSNLSLLMSELIMLIIFIIGLRILVSSVFKPARYKFFTEAFKTFLAAACAGTFSGYAAILTLFASKSFSNTWIGFFCVILYFICAAILVTVLYFADEKN